MFKILCIIYVRIVSAFILFVLFVQVADKQQRQMAEARIAELEAEKQKEQAKLEEQKLLQELRKMEATGYNPVVSAFKIICHISTEPNFHSRQRYCHSKMINIKVLYIVSNT
jgi:hypothetical protein